MCSLTNYRANELDVPKIITSSVVRSSHQGESHGGVCLVDLEPGECQQVIDWNDPGINWEGRGSDRGLRGIAVHQENVDLAASDEIFVYDRQFRLIELFRNRYLKHCREICLSGDKRYLTGRMEFDSGVRFAQAAVGMWLRDSARTGLAGRCAADVERKPICSQAMGCGGRCRSCFYAA